MQSMAQNLLPQTRNRTAACPHKTDGRCVTLRAPLENRRLDAQALFNFRRLVVRYEYHAENFQGLFIWLPQLYFEAFMRWVVIILWLLGYVTSYTMGGFIHILLVVAIILVLVRIIQGRKPL